MKRLLMMYMILQFSVIIVFADENNEIYNVFQNKLDELIECKYIKKSPTITHLPPSIISNYGENALDRIYIEIYFNAGVYDLKDNFNNIFDNILLVEMKKIFPNYDFFILTFYPFNIILTDNISYNFDEKQNIINEINFEFNTEILGIKIENIFQNSVYGYIQDRIFFSVIEIPENIIKIDRVFKDSLNSLYNIIFKYFSQRYIINF
jgi:hypothetical protein